MIFSQENVQLIREHWDKLMPNCPLSESYLPLPFEDVGEEGNLIDGGQDDNDFQRGRWDYMQRVEQWCYLLFVFGVIYSKVISTLD
jgi:hypothetical protein